MKIFENENNWERVCFRTLHIKVCICIRLWTVVNCCWIFHFHSFPFFLSFQETTWLGERSKKITKRTLTQNCFKTEHNVSIGGNLSKFFRLWQKENYPHPLTMFIRINITNLEDKNSRQSSVLWYFLWQRASNSFTIFFKIWIAVAMDCWIWWYYINLDKTYMLYIASVWFWSIIQNIEYLYLYYWWRIQDIETYSTARQEYYVRMWT